MLRHLLTILAFVNAGGASAFAQTWPAKPIRLIVCYAPGGVTDVVARLIAQPLSEASRPVDRGREQAGRAGMIGSEIVADAPPDGYTLLMYVDGNTILPSIMKQDAFDPLKTFAPITVLGRGSHVIVAHPSLSVRSLGELIAYAKQASGRAVLCLAWPRQPAEPVGRGD